MSRLIPCSSCRRHVRRAELACPFCEMPLADSTVQLPATRAVPPGTKRAALFAMGVGFAASACEAEPIDVPIYGAPNAPVAGSGGAAGNGGTAGTGGADFGLGGDGAGGASAGRGGSNASDGAPDASADAAPDAAVDAGDGDAAP